MKTKTKALLQQILTELREQRPFVTALQQEAHALADASDSAIHILGINHDLNKELQHVLSEFEKKAPVSIDVRTIENRLKDLRSYQEGMYWKILEIEKLLRRRVNRKK